MSGPDAPRVRGRREPLDPAYWDRYARRVDRAKFQDQIARYKKEVHLRLIRAWYPCLEGRTILKTDSYEEAFGRDALLDALSSSARLAVGMDISTEIALRAKGRFPALAFTATNTTRLPFHSSVFDLIVSNSTLDHLVPADVRLAVREFARVLKPDGTMVLTLDSAHNPLHVLSHWLRRIFGWFYTDRCYTVPEARRILEENGFRVLESHAVTISPFPSISCPSPRSARSGRRSIP